MTGDCMIPIRIPWKTIFRLTGKLLFVAIVAPWVALSIGAAVVRFLERAAQSIRAAKHSLDTHATCPAGHASALHGTFECRSCGALFAGFAFAECPVCSEICGYVQCERCGLAIRNPLA